MEIYILDQKTLDRISTIDVYESFQWDTSFNEIGAFQLDCPKKWFSLLQIENLVQNTMDDNFLGVIEYINVIKDDTGYESLIVKGHMLETLLNRRIAVGDYAYETLEPSEISARLIELNCVSSEEGRKFPLLEIGNKASSPFGPTNYASSNKLLLDEIKGLFKQNQLGFNLKPVYTEFKFGSVTMTNIIPNSSFESNTSWTGAVYDTSQRLYGNRAMKFPSGQTTQSSCDLPTPIINHIYYGRHYKKTNGNNTPPDCRFEWFAGDGYGLNWVFGRNEGNYPDWTIGSAVHIIKAVNASKYICRNFSLNSTADMWVDGLMIIDLTQSFGAGNEPSKEWCDENIPYFDGTKTVDFSKNRLRFNAYTGINRTEEGNTVTNIVTKTAINSVTNSVFANNLQYWTRVGDGTNYAGAKILYEENKKFVKTKIQDRYPVYDNNNVFLKWEYFWKPTGYIYQDIQFSKDHIYYLSVSVTNNTSSVLGYGLLNDKGNTTFNVPRTSGTETFRSLYVKTDDLSNKFVLGQGELEEIPNQFVYTEKPILVDLTVTFGAGKEPTLEWCTENFTLSDSLTYRQQIISFVPNFNDPLLLSRDRDNLLSVEYTKDSVSERNMMYIKGEGITTSIAVGNPVGTLRKETFLDLSSEIPRVMGGITIPEPSYVAMLQNRGKTVLRDLVVNEYVDTKYYLLSNKKFRKNFYLGDLVMCEDQSIGFSVNLRLTSASEVWDSSGYSISITLGDETPKIYDTIKLLAKGVV